MFNDFFNTFSNFINMNRTTFDNILSLIIYLIIIFLSLKSGANGYTLVFAYVITSGILTLLGLSSIFNIVELLTNFIKDILRAFNPFARDEKVNYIIQYILKVH